MKELFLHWFIALAVLLPALPAAAQERFPVDEKSRFERELEEKTNQNVLAVLGPNKARVMVQAEMDFSSTEKMELLGPSAAAAGAGTDFAWKGIGQNTRKDGPHLLPGFPVASTYNQSAGAGADGTKSYSRKFSFPSSFVKRLIVTAVINKELSAAEAESAANFISDLLGINARRGDEINIIRAPFAPLWKTVWFSPVLMEAAFKYGLLTLLGGFGTIAVVAAFLMLARSVGRMAKVQEHQINMEFPGGAAAAPGAPPGFQALEGGGPKAEAEAATVPAPDGEEKVVFSVRPDQVPFMVHMFARENPANVAIVADHLDPEIRSAFLSGLPPETASEVLASMAEVRFVKPEMIAVLKDELARRFSGAVGGLDKVLEAFARVSLREKSLMLRQLESRHPGVAGKVRSKIFLFEDIERLGDKDLGMLATSVKTESWAAVLPSLNKEFAGKLRAQLAERAWQMIEQTAKYGAVSSDKLDAAMEAVVSTALKLIEEGRMANPLTVAAGNGKALGKDDNLTG